MMVNRLAAAALTVNTLLTPLVNPLALAVNCLFVPTESISRLVKVATPLPAAVPKSRLVVPSNGPVPAVSVKVTILLAVKPEAERFPNWSLVRRTGWVASKAPAIPEPGCVVNANRLARPATSVNAPKLVLLAVTAAIVAVPVFVRLPLANGVPALGRTRTFCQVSEQVTPGALMALTVKVI